tara:strand:+ start:424 stop:1146 length:723 start_codon:yes stop_codon:yes gene_type:complete
MSTIIAMWSGPRNLSTALMRSFGNRLDSYISDEPFYPYYLKNSNIKHPMKKRIISKGNTNMKMLVNYITGPIPEKKSIWYQKHMAQHNILGFDLKWTYKIKNCFLIRNPNDVILSYSKKNCLNSYLQLGYQHQLNLINDLKKKNIEYWIIDADDLVSKPKHILQLLCKKLKIGFDKKMLWWEKGPKPYDGIWSEHWYDDVNQSEYFKPKIKKTSKFPSEYIEIYNLCENIYQQLYSQRLF